jgi:NADH-quinone oxidoreductase subunit N
MRSADLLAILPLVVVAAVTIVVMLAIAVRRNHRVTAALTLTGLALAFASISMAAPETPRHVTPLLTADGYALFYTGLILAGTFVTVLLAHSYWAVRAEPRPKGAVPASAEPRPKRAVPPEELYLLLLIATTGALVLVYSSHFASFFLGLEILSVALYALIGYAKAREPLEAALKYLVLAAASAAFLLFGMALIYAELGTMEFHDIGAALALPGADLTLLLPAFALIVTGFGFKLALVPFHLWTPDVYQGASAPVTAYIATVSKGAMFALLLRYFRDTNASNYPAMFAVFAIIAIASMLAGNLLALLQNNVKRILAYSSIAHLGYVLVAFLAGGERGAEAVTFYLVAYFVTILGAFGVIAVLSPADREWESIDDYRGLFYRRPALAGVFTAMLLSLAGIPLTAGFIGKFYIVAAGASAAQWALIIILVVTSAIGLFYYLRIIVAIYSSPGAESAAARLAPVGAATLAALTVLLIWLGVYPRPWLDLIGRAVRLL